LLSDEIAGRKNDFGFGYFVEHQRIYGNTLVPATFGSRATSTSPAVPGTAAYFQTQPELGEGDYSFFVRDQFATSDRLTAFVNAWSRRSNVTQKTTFDPRVPLVFRPTSRDVVRLTAGRADGDPAAAIKSNGVFTNINNPSSLNPSCTLPNAIAHSGNPSLSPEAANDAEAAYGKASFVQRRRADHDVRRLGDQQSRDREPVERLCAKNLERLPLFGRA